MSNSADWHASLHAALRGCRADVFAPVTLEAALPDYATRTTAQPETAVNMIALRISPNHVILLAVSTLERADEAADLLAQPIESTRLLFRGTPIAGPRVHLLRVVAVTTGGSTRMAASNGSAGTRWSDDGVVMMPLDWLVRRLRFSHDTDDVWLDIASLDRYGLLHNDGWIPRPGFVPDSAGLDRVRHIFRTLDERPIPADPPGRDADPSAAGQGFLSNGADKTERTIRQEKALDRRLRQLGLAPSELWASVHIEADTWQLIDVDDTDQGIYLLCVAASTGDAVFTAVTDTPLDLRDMHVALAQAALDELVLLGSYPRSRRRSNPPGRAAAAVTITFTPSLLADTQPTSGWSDPDSIAIRADWHDGWFQFELGVSVDRALESWAQIRQTIAPYLAAHLWPRDSRRRKQALANWARSGPRIFGQRALTDPSLQSSGHPRDTEQARSALEQAVLDAAVAASSLFDLAERQRLTPTLLSGLAARTVADTILVPALQAAIDRVLDDIDTYDVLAQLLAVLQVQLGAHLSRSGILSVHTNGPWIGSHLSAHLVSTSNSQHNARVAEMLVEMALRRPPRRGRPLDRIDLAILEACASTALTIAIGRQADMAHVAHLDVTIGEKTLSVRQGQTDGVDLNTYRHVLEILRATSVEPAPSADESDAGERPFQPFDISDTVDAASRLTLELDLALRALTSTGMSELIATLATAASLSTGPDGIVRTSRSELVADAARWANAESPAIEAACDVLTLSPTAFARAPYEFWKLEGRPIRLATRPLVAVGDELWFSPARVRGTQLLFANYLGDGRLPWPVDPVPFNPRDHPPSSAVANHASSCEEPEVAWAALRQATERLRQNGNRQAELEAIKRLRDAGWQARGSIKPHTRGAPALLPGEIDVLTADTDRRILWVLEVKDLQAAFSAVELSHRVTSIHGTGWAGAAAGGQRRHKDHVMQLQHKVNAVAADLPAALRLLGLTETLDRPDTVENWQVAAAFVTPTPTPAAFVHPPRSLFLLIDNLPEVLETLQPGDQGFVWMPNASQAARLAAMRQTSFN